MTSIVAHCGVKPEEVWELTQFEVEVLWDAALERNGWKPEGRSLMDATDEERMEMAAKAMQYGKALPAGVPSRIRADGSRVE